MLGHLMSHHLATCGLETHTEKVPCGLIHVPGCCLSLTRPPGQEARGNFPAKNAGRVDRSCLNLKSFQPLLRPASGHRAASPHSVLPSSSTGIWVLLVTSRGGVRSRHGDPKAPACMPSLALAMAVHPQDLDLHCQGA